MMLKKLIRAVIPVFCLCLLVLNCISNSRGKYLWFDELLTYYPTTLPTFSQMLDFTLDKVNGGHYLYFILMWFFGKIFWVSALSMRLFSCLGVCIAFILTWITLQREKGFYAATAAVPYVFLTTPLILYQNSEARFYGMFLMGGALLLFITAKFKSDNLFSFKKAACLFGAHGVLPLIHPFGFLYSLIFLGGTILSDLRKKQLRYWYYLSSLSGWLMFIPFIPSFLIQNELRYPHYWIPRPSWGDLKNLYDIDFSQNSYFLFSFISLVLAWKGAQILKKQEVWSSFFTFKKLFNLNGTAILLYLLPGIIWVGAQFLTPAFLARYLILSILGIAIFYANIISLLLSENLKKSIVFKIIFCAFVGMLFFQFYRGQIPHGNSASNPSFWLAYIPSDIPVLIDEPHAYLEAKYYAPENLKERLYLGLDWNKAVGSNILNETQDYQAMTAFKKHINDSHIVELKDFLDRHRDFIILGTRSMYHYLKKSHPNYQFQATSFNTWRVWLPPQ